MDKKELEKRLKSEKSVELIREIVYNNKSYVMTLTEKNNYVYFEIDDNVIKDVTDENILKYFKESYEIKSSTIIY